MKKIFLLILIILTLSPLIYSQQLVGYFSFPNTTTYNYLWGVTQRNDTLWVGSDYMGMLYKVTKTGTITDSVVTPFTFNHGLIWDGTGFWIAEDYRTSGGRIYKVNSQGMKIDSIVTTSISAGIGGIALDGNSIWLSVYSPDYATYPNAYAYKISIATKQIVDTIPLRGRQVTGIAVKGDTIFYVNDNFQGEQERIYAYRKAAGDTIFTFPAPDPDNDCVPGGLFWDGQYLWLMANRIGGASYQYRNLYKYALTGQGSPIISVTPVTINFGNVIIGQTASSPITISNIGTAKLIINSFTFTNTRFGINPSTVPDTIQVGQSKNYNVTFTPNVFDTTSGELRIGSNDFGNPIKVVTLRGKGVYTGPYISTSVNNISWNNKRVNSLSGGYLNITNQGTVPLQINNISFNSQIFKFDTINTQFPIVIDTQKTRVVRIWFNPNSSNSFSDTATISSNAINSPQLKIYLSGNGLNITTQLGDVLWEGNIPPNPGTSSQDYQPKSMKRINDVNGDGINDIIVATENYWTICYNGNSSGNPDTLWKFSTYFGSINTGSVDWEDAMQIRDDINGDGIQDIVIGCGGGNEMVYTLSGSNGKKIWEFGNPNSYSDGDINGLRADKDYNNDNINDVIVAASGEADLTGRHSVICINGLNGQLIFQTQLAHNFVHDVENLPNGGVIDYSNNGGPYGVMGFNNSGIQQWTFATTSTNWNLKRIPDINADNIPDITGYNSLYNGTIYAISGANGNQLWSLGTGSSNNGTIMVLDDKDKNGYNDVTMSGPQSLIRLDSKLGNILWQTPLGGLYIRDIDSLNDITNDTLNEIVVGTQEPGKVVVVNGMTGAVLFEFTFGQSNTYRADRVTGLRSIDGNTSYEFVAGCRDGRLKCFSGGPGQPIGITHYGNNIPKKYELYQNYPNPFNPSTKIKFDVPVKVNEKRTKLVIYDIMGQQIETLIDKNLEAGIYEVEFHAEKYSSGIYFYKMIAGDFKKTMKMVLIK